MWRIRQRIRITWRGYATQIWHYGHKGLDQTCFVYSVDGNLSYALWDIG